MYKYIEIRSLIDRNYRSIDIEEEAFEVAEWLKEIRYLVPVNDNLEAVGIVTIDDIHKHPYGKIIDCDINKPKVSPCQTTIEVFNIMKETDLHYLPVFEKNVFIGVISLFSIAVEMAKQMNPHIK